MSSERVSTSPGILPVLLLTLAGVGVAGLVGCRQEEAPQGKPVLTVYCGAGLRGPVAELLAAFQRQHPVTFATDYAGSEHLLNKIKLSGKGDLFLPGDRYYVDLLEQAGQPVVLRRTVCYFVPTILVARGNPHRIAGLGDLLKAGVRLGLGDEKAAAIGRISRMIFEKNGYDWQQVLAGAQYLAPTVNALGEHVEVGSLDAVIIWDGLAGGYLDRAEVVPIPIEQNVISTVDVAVLGCSRQARLAGQVARFLAGEQGRRVFARHGFSVEPPSPGSTGSVP